MHLQPRDSVFVHAFKRTTMTKREPESAAQRVEQEAWEGRWHHATSGQTGVACRRTFPACSPSRSSIAAMTPPGVVRQIVDRLPLPQANLAGLAVAAVLHWTRIWPLPGPRRMQRALGGVLIVSGCLVAAWATAERPEPDLERPEGVTTTGPYRFSRNPMYVGWHLIHLGLAVSAGSTWGLVTLAAAGVETHHQIRREEADMLAHFGPEFARYTATVPRYFAAAAVRSRTASRMRRLRSGELVLEGVRRRGRA
jgi:protein-S-isoprenylcysteine O-methyltransferase Ste14